MTLHKRKIIISADFSDFITGPVSMNGATSWTPEWLVDQLILKSGFNIIGGAPKVGKSLLRSHILVSVMAGRPVFGQFDTQPVEKVLLMAGEEILEVEEARIRRAANGLAVGDQEVPIYIMPQKGFFFDDYPSFENFIRWVLDEQFDIVCIDPLIRWHRANENVSGELSPVLSNLRRLCHEGVTIVLVHHTSKPKEGSEDWPLGYLLRGSSDLAAIYDNLIILKSTTGGKLRREVLVDSRPAEAPDAFKIDLDIDDTSFSWKVSQTTIDVVKEKFRTLDPSERMGTNEMAKAIHRRKQDVSLALQSLYRQGLIEKCEGGYSWVEVPL
jgi:hypothetical protein